VAEGKTETIPEVVLGLGERQGQPRLRVLYSPNKGIPPIQTLPTGITVVGRKAGDNPECLNLPDDSAMSGTHASFDVAERDLTVRVCDMGSKNGTHLAGLCHSSAKSVMYGGCSQARRENLS
jgi:hypothetical protein